MSWLPSLAFPEFLKKRICKYIIQNYIGEFLQGEVRLDQLNVDLYHGTGSVTGKLQSKKGKKFKKMEAGVYIIHIYSDLSLNLTSLNEQLSTFGVPLQVIDGYVRNIEIHVPWNALLKDSSHLTLTGLEMSVQMAETPMTMQGMCESLYQTACTMSTSIEIAEKVKEEVNEEVSKHLFLKYISIYIYILD